jgi:hypothetical protein
LFRRQNRQPIHTLNYMHIHYMRKPGRRTVVAAASSGRYALVSAPGCGVI